MKSAIQQLDAKFQEAAKPTVDVPTCTFEEFLLKHARVRMRDGSYAPFSFVDREALAFVVELIDKVIRNTKHRQSVVIEGATFAPGALKGTTLSVCGGAQFGKTVLELNLGGFVTTIEFLNFGYYTSDRELLATIVDTKFRPDVVDQIPWLKDLIQVGKVEGRSGKSVDRKNAFQVSSGDRKAFGYFNGMQKPPTTITLDIAVLDEVDDIPEKNIGFIAGRMTNSDVQLTAFVGTQRIASAGQNARYKAGTMHHRVTPCAHCGAAVDIPEQWPGVCRVAMDGAPKVTDPKLDETMQYDPSALYYPACPDCGTALDRRASRYVAEHPERAKVLNWSIRISQMDIPALDWKSIVASWFAALSDPNPEAMAAWHCDRRAIPNAGAMQPITASVLDRARRCSLAERPEDLVATSPYAMTLVGDGTPRIAGMDMGPRSWLWIDNVRSPFVTALAWAEMVPSGTAYQRIVEIYAAGAFSCIFLDAGGEPDLTKRIVLALNGLEQYQPPAVPQQELRGMTLSNIGAGVTWNGERGTWSKIRAAAVEFSLREAGGVQQALGFTQDGRIYPLIKCNRAESIQAAVNDLLTPSEGVLQQVDGGDGKTILRLLPRQRLPESCLGAGVTNSVLDTHLQNVRKETAAGVSGADWVDGVENHLGLAKVYARLAALVTGGTRRNERFEYEPVRDRAPGATGRREILV